MNALHAPSARTLAFLAAGAAALGAPLLAAQETGRQAEVVPVREVGPTTPAAGPRPVDLVICLDTSGSMQGLIDSARERIWAIVNDLALAEPQPLLRVGLLAYGGKHYDPAQGYVSLRTDLTQDLDLVSQELFALGAEGSVELVGRVLDRATRELAWSADPHALKMIVVAGNESADQDPEVPFREACARAIAADITVDALYCGPEADEIAPGWRQVARLADGQFASIDASAPPTAVASPFDDRLSALSAELNRTYLAYGAQGADFAANQWVQDENAAGQNSAAAATRATCKASVLYCNSSWDLVDRSAEADFDLSAIPVEELPEAMRDMTPGQRVAHLAATKARRARVQAHIAALGERRDAWVATCRLAQAAETDAVASFDEALRGSMRAKARARGFRFRDATAPAETADAAPEPEPPVTLCPALEALLPADVRVCLPLSAIPAALRAGVPELPPAAPSPAPAATTEAPEAAPAAPVQTVVQLVDDGC